MLLSVKSDLRNIVKTQLRKTLNQMAKDTERAMKNACPVETGELRADIHRKNQGKNTVLIGSSLPQMYYSNYGNGSKTIRPKKSKLLWFESKKTYNLPMSDGMYYAKEVQPYKGTRWIERVKKYIQAKYGG